MQLRSLAADDVTSTLVIGGSKVDVTIEGGKLRVSQAELLHWVAIRRRSGGHILWAFYPVPRAQIHIIPVDGNGVRHGQTFATTAD